MYDDLWTAGKGMYKSEPVAADHGEVIIYAPHVEDVSSVHGRVIDEVGYHCRDYFLGQWDRFRTYPAGILAHSTHVKGNGTYDAVTGVEDARVQVTLATGISEARCRLVNLAYRNPETVDPREYEGDPKTLVIPRAGEMLYRVRGKG
jgi:nickel-dependent lactate racemase